jgi:hypothetical protein
MARNGVEVRISVRVDGRRVGRRKIKRSVSSLNDGRELLDDTHVAVDALADELQSQVVTGV